MLRLLCFLCFWCLQLPVHAAGTGYAIEQAFYADTQEQATIETVSKLEFRSFKNDLRLGYKDGAVWLRLKIVPEAITDKKDLEKSPLASSLASPLVLRVAPYILDHVELYEQLDGQWVRQVGGDQLPPRSGLCPDDAHCFSLKGSLPETAYLRVKNAGVMAVQLDLLTPDGMVNALVDRAGQRSLSLTLALGLLMLGLGYWAVERSKLLFTYCVFQLSIAIFVVANSGWLGVYLKNWTPASLDVFNHFSFVWRVGITTLICALVLTSYHPTPLYKKLVGLLLAASALNILLVLLGQIRLALQLNYVVFATNLLVQIYGLSIATSMGKYRRRIFLSCYCLYLVVICIGTLNVFWGTALEQFAGMPLHFGDWRLNGAPIGALFFWVVVSEQASRNAAKSLELEALRLKAEQARATEDKFSERRALIDMLTHELKNPLGTIKFALATLRRKAANDPDALRRVHRIDSSVNRMDDLIEHVARSNKIELTDLPDQFEAIAAGEMVRELIGDYETADRFNTYVEEGAVFRTYRQMLQVIFENLLSNAHKYTAPDKEIHVAVTVHPDGGTCFEIRNQVRADAAPDESRLFERYYRHPSVQNQPGMGIGLSLVQAAARKIGAEVLYRKEAQWAIFAVRIPN